MSERNSSADGPSELAMDDIPNQTLGVLKTIQRELQKQSELLQKHSEQFDQINARLDQANGRLDQSNGRLDVLAERVDTGFEEINRRLDGVLAISGSHHTELESRVRRIEDHLGLSSG